MTLPMSLAETGLTSTGEEVFFWVVAPLAVLAALGLLFARKAIYAAMCVVFVMIALAGFYIVQEAIFLGVAQIVVYTGAIMMLFLFVLMLVGVDSSDSVVETLKGQRWIGFLAGAGLIALIAAVAMRATMPAPVGLEQVNADTNPVGVARLLFSDYVLAMEVSGVLLVTAAVGAVVLTRAERLRKRTTQRDVAHAKMAAYAAEGGRIRGLPAPGVYARHNAADVPALGADGTPIDESVPRVLRIRGQQRTIASVSPELAAQLATSSSTHAGDHGARSVTQSGLPGMPGTAPSPGSRTTDGEVPTSQSTEDTRTKSEPEEQR
ncbi:NADH-quinone oxidoreductase subunit J [Georgenia sp. H159]|uniref:NADH-quinone oxidoreductase subunit J n=1 Tax=Georgenia sp. H159 TaxID=3076115 RepID=UPI002D79354D|nr:NADH-quinone oxidoreductase subunit J [Georgenia sp. H159]